LTFAFSKENSLKKISNQPVVGGVCTPIISVFGRQRQKNPRPAWAALQDPVSKNEKKILIKQQSLPFWLIGYSSLALPLLLIVHSISFHRNSLSFHTLPEVN
jgi:hypothetical protein